MSTILESMEATKSGPEGPTFRMSADQFRRLESEGILTRDDRVELRDGLLYLKDAPPGDRFYRLSVEQYHAIAVLEILTKDDRVELLEGYLVAKMSKHPPHTIAKGLTHDALLALLPAGWFMAIEDPVAAIDSGPEPDLAIIRGTRRDYPDRAPGPRDVALVVEVADASLPRDRSQKKRLHARSGFPTYWLVNLVAGRIEVYTDPTGPIENPDYLRRQDFKPGETIPLLIEGREIGRLAVADLLP